MHQRTIAQWLISGTSSAVAHGVAIGIAVGMVTTSLLWLSPPEGVNSIELIASLPSESTHEATISKIQIVANSLPAESAAQFDKLCDAQPMNIDRQSDLPIPQVDLVVARNTLPRRTSGRLTDNPTTESGSPTLPRAASPASVSARNAVGVKTDTLPRKIDRSCPAPKYPKEALSKRIEGSVILRVRVGPEGTVTHASIHRSSGYASLDRAAIAAVRRWLFQPALISGQPVTKEIAVPVDFEIAR